MAKRLRPARFGDARLWLGIVLVVVSVLVGSAVMTAGTGTVTVMSAGHDLSAGSSPDDLVPVVVNAAAAGGAYLTGEAPEGSILRWPVTAGELVPRSALASGGAPSRRLVTIPVDPLHAPPALMAGDLVDVWASAPSTSSSSGAPPVEVLAGVMVSGVAAEASGMGGEIAVVLAVPEGDVGGLVTASRSGVIDLVAVPVGSQGMVPSGGLGPAAGVAS